MRTQAQGFLALAVCAAASCSSWEEQSWEERFDALQASSREELTSLYPVGARFEPDANRFFRAFERWDLDAAPPSQFADFLLARVRTSHNAAVACWYGEIPRLTAGSSVGAFGIWADYVFVDDDRRVLVAWRQFVD